MKQFFFIFIGGGLGSSLRYLIGKIFPYTKEGFPIATFIVNIVGCFLIGVFFEWFSKSNLIKSDLSLFFIIGLCGGLTTFSTFGSESLNLFKQGSFFLLITYSSLSFIIGLLMVYLGGSVIRFFS